MKKITLSKIVAGAAIAAISISTAFAQTNIGAECGCPAFTARGTAIALSTLPGMVLGTTGGGNPGPYAELTQNTTLTCDKLYTIDRKIYVASGVTLTIMPGTVLRGASDATPANATALIVERGGKLIADGSKECPIVFTALADPMDGSYSLTNVGKWGGVALLGRATNNLRTGDTYSAGGVNGVGFIEGFAAVNLYDQYGGTDDADNSGTLRYVSIRHAGAILALANELNGLSLGSVGSGTIIENLEIIANADDNIEFFGGKVNVKYVSTLFGDDDMFDYDLGWQGKAQFLFGIQSDSVTGAHSGDNGFECDADDNKTFAHTLKSHPVIYNATVIGNGHILPTADNTGPAAIQAKENTEGEIYNSIFANFRIGLFLGTSRSNATNLGDAYDNWTNSTTAYNNGGTGRSVLNSLKIKNNTFIGINSVSKPGASDSIQEGLIGKKGMTKAKNPALFIYAAGPLPADLSQLTADGNTSVASVSNIDYNWAWNSAAHTGYDSNPFHATPKTNIASSIIPPADGFFTQVSYRGAFDANRNSWLSDWAFAEVLTSQQSNPTDINEDGITNTDDFLLLVDKYGATNSK